MISYKKASSVSELQQIINLQRDNVPEGISSEEKETEGFVTVVHTLELLTAMNTVCQHSIAIENDTVVGYALCMHPSFGDEIDVLKPMFSEIQKTIDPTTSWMVMGQICIDKNFRKKGIFRRLYEHMSTSIRPEFTTIITEVDVTNTRSLAAHYAIGFKLMSTYTADRKEWVLIRLN